MWIDRFTVAPVTSAANPGDRRLPTVTALTAAALSSTFKSRLVAGGRFELYSKYALQIPAVAASIRLP